GIELGEKGTCKLDDCLNHGQCIEFYDSHKCNCNNTPFVGQRCNQDVGIFVPKDSELMIPWQHPAQISSCFRIAVQSFSSNYSLIRAKAHYQFVNVFSNTGKTDGILMRIINMYQT
ncbi:hypothetical protein WUBG_18320, partial [Wuchereria bancrofti]